jgi:hypothetical protein
VYRTLPVTFPLKFSFDFHSPLTSSNNQCSSTSSPSEAGWMISFNAATLNVGNPLAANMQIAVFQNGGSRNVNRAFMTGTGLTYDTSPNLTEPISGWEDYTNSSSHVTGVITA